MLEFPYKAPLWKNAVERIGSLPKDHTMYDLSYQIVAEQDDFIKWRSTTIGEITFLYSKIDGFIRPFIYFTSNEDFLTYTLRFSP